MNGLFAGAAGRTAGVLLLIAGVVLHLTACSRVTQENYRKLQVGMEYAQVVQILGEPSRCDSVLTVKTCEWGKKDRTITIRFVAEKVVFFFSKGM